MSIQLMLYLLKSIPAVHQPAAHMPPRMTSDPAIQELRSELQTLRREVKELRKLIEEIQKHNEAKLPGIRSLFQWIVDFDKAG